MYVDYMHHRPSHSSAVGVVGFTIRQRKGTKKKKKIVVKEVKPQCIKITDFNFIFPHQNMAG